MPRATRLLPAAQRESTRAVDTLILPFAQRQTQRGFVFGVNGSCIELDFAEPVRLRTDDVLVLDDGGFVEVVAEAEPLLEVRATDPATLARLAWHLGDRHVPVEVRPNRLRVHRDPAIESVLQTLGAKVVAIEAPFEPEGGAYAVPGDGHHERHHHGHHHHDNDQDHTHDHDDDHDHDHHHGHGDHHDRKPG